MAIIKPFKALRPLHSLVSKVAALPYDVVSLDEAKCISGQNEYSFLHVDRAEVDLDESIDHHDVKVYEKARQNLEHMISKGIFMQDSKECLYIYRLIRGNRSQHGLVCCTSIDDYIDGTIKKHELTLAVKENDRVNHVKYTSAHTGPIMMTYRQDLQISATIEGWIAKNEPVYDFKSEDGVMQTVWAIQDDEVISKLINLFSNIQSLYIADGHHRAAAAVKVGQMNRKDLHSTNQESDHFLSVIFPDSELTIMEYNRLIKGLNGMQPQKILAKVNEKFEIIYSGKESFKPSKKNTYGMYLDGIWHGLSARPGSYIETDPVKNLDVSILHDNLILPIFGISDPRTDARIDFAGGSKGLTELEARVNCGEAKVAISMFPTSMKEIMEVADSGLTMPPKSTWFEPKLRSGILIHRI
jgi:uncharacterized protein (DUF1015 family)